MTPYKTISENIYETANEAIYDSPSCPWFSILGVGRDIGVDIERKMRIFDLGSGINVLVSRSSGFRV